MYSASTFGGRVHGWFNMKTTNTHEGSAMVGCLAGDHDVRIIIRGRRLFVGFFLCDDLIRVL